MTPCTPALPCDAEYPFLCEPREITALAKRLVVEDSAACDKTIQTPPSGQVLISNANGTISWTNGASSTVLRKTSTGSVDFATSNTILQSGPVNLGSQPLTTTGSISSASLTVSGIAASGNISLTAATTSTTVGSSGVASALPANPAGYIQISINGTPYKLPYYSV
jgi:hypothetical protein